MASEEEPRKSLSPGNTQSACLGKKLPKTQLYHMCMNCQTQKNQFHLIVIEHCLMVKVKFRLMYANAVGHTQTHLHPVTTGKYMSLWLFVASWQQIDTDKNLNRWRLTRCDYLLLLELTVHQSHQQREMRHADSCASEIFCDSVTSNNKGRKCVKCFKCVTVPSDTD